MRSSLFTWFRRISGPCFFVGHDHPIKVLKRAKLHFECPRCGEDIGEVLKGQAFKARQPAETLRLVSARRVG
jgi:hypothetical protein